MKSGREEVGGGEVQQRLMFGYLAVNAVIKVGLSIYGKSGSGQYGFDYYH